MCNFDRAATAHLLLEHLIAAIPNLDGLSLSDAERRKLKKAQDDAIDYLLVQMSGKPIPKDAQK